MFWNSSRLENTFDDYGGINIIFCSKEHEVQFKIHLETLKTF